MIFVLFKGGVREAEEICLPKCFNFQMVAMAQTEPEESQEPGVSYRSPRSDAETQGLGPRRTVFPSILAEAEIESGTAETGDHRCQWHLRPQ